MLSSGMRSFFSVGAGKPKPMWSKRSVSLPAIHSSISGVCLSVSPSFGRAPTPKRLFGCAGALRPTEITPLRISTSRLPWRSSVSWMRHGLQCRRALRSIRFLLSAAIALAAQATIPCISRDASASLRASGWPGCRKSKGSRTGARMSDPTKVSRRLVAVFAADVEGYSHLMGADEVGTLKGLTERRAILDRPIGDHGGRIANTAGDSVLSEFGSAVEAVQCAVDAQAALAVANTGFPPDKHINFRIGVHIGDVMVRAGDLFGDGVNIAARLQSIATPGGVCVSSTTYEQVRKVLPITFADLGAQHVKNIHEPIRAYQVAAPSKM